MFSVEDILVEETYLPGAPANSGDKQVEVASGGTKYVNAETLDTAGGNAAHGPGDAADGGPSAGSAARAESNVDAEGIGAEAFA